jgi:hypothetical protein
MGHRKKKVVCPAGDRSRKCSVATWRRRPRWIIFVLAAAAASTLGAAAIVGALALSAGRSVAASQPTPTAGYAVFAAPPSAADAMPSGLAAEQTPGAEIRSLPTTQPGLLAWAVAGSGRLCVAESDAGGGSEACAAASTLTGDPNTLLYSATAEGAPSADADEVDLVVGLAPNGVGEVTFHFGDDTSAQATVLDNGFQLATAGLETISSLSWQDAAGATHTQEVGTP